MGHARRATGCLGHQSVSRLSPLFVLRRPLTTRLCACLVITQSVSRRFAHACALVVLQLVSTAMLAVTRQALESAATAPSGSVSTLRLEAAAQAAAQDAGAVVDRVCPPASRALSHRLLQKHVTAVLSHVVAFVERRESCPRCTLSPNRRCELWLPTRHRRFVRFLFFLVLMPATPGCKTWKLKPRRPGKRCAHSSPLH